MSGEVVVLVPSRSRPESLVKCWESVRDSSDAVLLAYVDKDQRELYQGLPANYYEIIHPGSNEFALRADADSRFSIVIGPRFGPVHAINTLCHAARPGGGLREDFPDAHIWTYLTDDSIIGPHGWDDYLVRTIGGFKNEIGVVSLAHSGTNDYVNFYAISTEMVVATGFYAVPESLYAWYWDTAMELVGDATDIVYAEPKDVDVTHDPQRTTDALKLSDEDCRKFAHWCISERKRIIRSARAAMNR